MMRRHPSLLTGTKIQQEIVVPLCLSLVVDVCKQQKVDQVLT